MISPKSYASSPTIAVPSSPSTTCHKPFPYSSTNRHKIRAHSDPNIFKNDRVLRTLISREMKQERTSMLTGGLPSQTEVKPGMRLEVANWMLGELALVKFASFLFSTKKHLVVRLN